MYVSRMSAGSLQNRPRTVIYFSSGNCQGLPFCSLCIVGALPFLLSGGAAKAKPVSRNIAAQLKGKWGTNKTVAQCLKCEESSFSRPLMRLNVWKWRKTHVMCGILCYYECCSTPLMAWGALRVNFFRRRHFINSPAGLHETNKSFIPRREV